MYALQLQEREYQEQIRQLNIQIAQLKKPKPRKKGTSNASKNSSSTEEPHPLAALQSATRGAGRKYALLHGPWPPSKDVFPLVQHVEGVDPYDSNTRYPTIGYSQDARTAALHRALAAELFSVIPATILPHITNEYVLSEVSS